MATLNGQEILTPLRLIALFKQHGMTVEKVGNRVEVWPITGPTPTVTLIPLC